MQLTALIMKQICAPVRSHVTPGSMLTWQSKRRAMRFPLQRLLQYYPSEHSNIRLKQLGSVGFRLAAATAGLATSLETFAILEISHHFCTVTLT